MLASPSVLARLDHAHPEARHGGDAFTVSPSSALKRRPELILATDRVGIEIYDVRSSRVLTSQGIPPANVFICPPVSVVVKGSGGAESERFTYWATAHNESGRGVEGASGVKLNCLHQFAGVSKLSSSALKGGKDVSRNINFLTVVARDFNQSTSRHSVLAIYEDCTVSCYSAKLEQVLWSEKSLSRQIGGEKSRIKYAVLVSEAVARSCLFKSRPDVLVSPSSLESDQASSLQVLALIEATERGGVKLRYFAVEQRIREILSLNIPIEQKLPNAKDEWWFYPKSGQLHRVRREDGVEMVVYDVSGLFPVKKHSLELSGVTSAICISPSEVAAFTKGSVQIVDIKWQSLQSEIPLSDGEEASSAALATPMSYFPSLKTIVIAKDNRLLSLKLFELEDGHYPGAKRRKVTLLANAFDRAISNKSAENTPGRISNKSLGKKMLSSAGHLDLRNFEESLGALLQNENIEEYDTAALKALQAESQQSNDLRFYLKDHPSPTFYTVNNLFGLKAAPERSVGSQASLTVKRMAPETFRHLLNRNMLTTGCIEASLRSVGKLASGVHLAPTAVVDALMEHDSSLHALIFYLSSAPTLSILELAVALRYALRSAQQMEKMESGRLTKDSEANLEEDNITYGSEDKSSVAYEIQQDQSQVSQPGFEGQWLDPDPWEDVMHNARSALGSCLSRLSIYDDTDIRNVLRSAMRPAEIMVLIDYMRIELASGGWLSRYIDTELEGEDDLSLQTSQITVLAKMLNCAIDSLGSTAWLSGANEQEEWSQSSKIGYMRAEINAALEGIEESASLEHMLNEFFRYADSEGQPASMQHRSTAKNGSIVTIPSAQQERQDSMLPLGLKKTNAVSKTKFVRGKKTQRSKRNLAWHEHRKVPEYSFERVVI